MINLHKLSLVTLSAAILASVGSNAPAAAAQLFFNVSGRFDDTPSSNFSYPELASGSFSGTFSFDSAALDQNPATDRGLYGLSSWGIDLLDVNGGLVGQLTSEDGGSGSIDTSLQLIIVRFGQSYLQLNFNLTIDDIITGGTRAGGLAGLVFQGVSSGPLNADVPPLGSLSPRFGLLVDSTVASCTTGCQGVQAYATGITAVPPPAAVPEPGTTAGLSLLGLSFLLKKKVAFCQKTKATVKARQATSI